MKTVIIFLLVDALYSSFDYKENSPHSMFSYNVAATDNIYPGYLHNPAYMPLWNTAYLSIDYSRPYMMQEINAGNIRAGWGYADFGLQAGWSRFGIREYSEDIIEINSGYKVFEFMSFGAGASCYHIYINTDEISYKYGTADYRLSLLLMPFDWMDIAYLQENLYALLEDENDLLYPEKSFGISLKPAPGVSLVWNINKSYYGYINSFSATANLLPFISLKGGYSRETSSYSASVNILYDHLSVSYGLSYHSYLGATHRIGVSVAERPVLFQQVSYKNKIERKNTPEKKKININECSYEELAASGLFTGEIAERIIKYRSIIGPVTEKGLIQIGLTDEELKKLRNYIEEPAEEPASEMKTAHIKYRKKYTNETKKLLFSRLLELDISATDALHIAEIMSVKNKNEIIAEIKKTFPEDKKKQAIKICEDLL